MACRLAQRLSISALCATALIAASCARGEPYTKETYVMGTKAWVTVAGMNRREAERAASQAFREMYRIESVMSNWRSRSEISRLNAEADSTPVAVSKELFALIDSSVHYSRATFGAFDITVRPLMTLWGFQGGRGNPPSADELAHALTLVGYEKIALDPSKETIALPAGMELDLAGVAKGYAVDRCVSVLTAFGARNALVNIGGNIYALGEAPGARGWTIGIRDPKGGLGTVGSILLSNEAVATSGDYENFVDISGKRYGHIIDPRTGEPATGVLSVTVVAPTGLESDALSTGLFVLGPERAREAASALGGVKALFALPEDDGIRYDTLGYFAGRLSLKDTRAAKQ
jgi:thiamine biosynthesis lipoprotein